MDSKIATMRIARQLQACEKGGDAFLAATATLVAEMATARSQTGAAVTTGQRAMRRVIAAQAHAQAAIADLARAHADLLKLGQERGDVPEGDCPELMPTVTGEIRAA